VATKPQQFLDMLKAIAAVPDELGPQVHQRANLNHERKYP
jgi:hypothetical protein